MLDRNSVADGSSRLMTRAEFAALKGRLFRQIAYDHKLSHAHSRLPLCVLDHVNCEDACATGLMEAYSGLWRISALTGMTEHTVITGLERITARGHWKWTPGRPGRGNSHHFEFIENTALGTPFGIKKPARSAVFKKGKTCTQGSISAAAKYCNRTPEILQSGPLNTAVSAVEQESNNKENNLDSCAVAVATCTDEAVCLADEDWLPKGRPTYGDLAAQRDNWANGDITEDEYQRRTKILEARREQDPPSEARPMAVQRKPSLSPCRAGRCLP
jgi:hypothetical protein